MSSLSDQIDRLTKITKSIAATAASTAALNRVPSSSQPFTRAVLNAPLADLIRDIDASSELGLFELTRPALPLPTDKEPPSLQYHEIQRVTFNGATPLRRHPRPEGPLKTPEPDPEIYAQAAMKYINRFQSIRPMPRAYSQVEAVMERLQASRVRIQELQERVKQQAENASAVEPKSLADDEQQRIDVLMERIALLKEQKENHFRKRLPKIQPKRVPAPKPPKATPRVDPEDEFGFWTTPTAAARTFKLSTGLLMDEHVDAGEMSMASFGSPPPTLAGIIQQPFQSFSHSINSQPPRSPESLVENATPSASPPPMPERQSPPLVPISPSPPLTPPSAPLISPPPDPEDLLPPPAAAAASPPRKGKIKITSDVDRIIARIWSTVGDIIMQGYHLAETKPLGAKATIAHLQTLAAQTTVPPSPSATSLSSLASAPTDQPTFQQIMTAFLLLRLLSEAPSYSLLLNVVKDAISSKGSELGAATSTQSSRVMYACIAKRLIKIDRKQGEQTVKFDFGSGA
ncbi:hypothetical protein PTI98_006408 [Pleurotus ostreatus]|nr:hypothetical protein PTI98_006408 [Pleurotus ostreatus]